MFIPKSLMKLLSISGFSLTQELTNPFPPWRNEKKQHYNIHNSVARACVCRRRSKLYTPAARFGLLVNATHWHELFQVCTYPNPQKISGDMLWTYFSISTSWRKKIHLGKSYSSWFVMSAIFRRQEMYCWLVVSTRLKNISQIGSFPQVGVNIKNIWNHHLDCYCVLQLRGLFLENDYNWETSWLHWLGQESEQWQKNSDDIIYLFKAYPKNALIQ